MLERKQVIDNKTGQVMADNVRHISSAFDDDKGYLFWARKSFAKSFIDVPYPKEMSKMDIANISILSKHMWSNTNMLGYRGSGGAKPYDVVMIAKAIELKQRQTYSFLKKMIDLGLMAKVDIKTDNGIETQYYINPIYFFSGNRIPLSLYLIFRKQLDGVLPGWVRERFMIDNMRK
ncbi:hypothetical protein [Pelosinus baikalensis]|uniref:Uncharacterized protein n=1 Tax=Pelosinus baikalensis TaxID=2892015 RepID=A0ABS8HQV9_9FIRM|nr:hypothetical protein [Pelosinus baikalensis]MCC5465556.1 hypothetical protein [Pelosinus baikalensis]